MLRVERDYELTPNLRENWNQLIEAEFEKIVSDWEAWPLLENVGTVWDEAPPRVQRATKTQAKTGMHSDRTSQISQNSNAGLARIYHNQSPFLNQRKRHFHQVWTASFQDAIWKRSAQAMTQLVKRFPFAEHFGHYWISGLMMATVWERLHASSIEMPFREHELDIVRAGYMPAGLAGTDWRTCRFLYY